MKTIKINNEEYISKNDYEKLKKSKIKILKEQLEIRPIMVLNSSITWGILPLQDIELIKKKYPFIQGGFVNKEEITFEKSTRECYPLINVNDTTYNYGYFIMAQQIANLLNADTDYKVFKSNKKDQPCLISFGDFGAIICPRIENEN